MNRIEEIGIWTGATVKNSVGDIFEVKDIALIVHNSYNFEKKSWDKEMTPVITMRGISGEEVSVSYGRLKQEYFWYKEPKVILPKLESTWKNKKFSEVGEILSAFGKTVQVRYENGVVRNYTDNYFFSNFVEVNKTK